MTSIDVVVHGATGRMGREVVAALCREEELRLVGAISKTSRGDYLALPDGSGSVPLSTDLKAMLDQTNPHVVVDFTNAGSCMNGATIVAEHHAALVTGTSGLSDQNLEQLSGLCEQYGIGIVVAPNFALGAVLLTYLAKQAAPFFEYVDIIEMHHEEKIDSPSGTALALAKSIGEIREFKRNVPEKETLLGTRGGDYQGVTVHSVRMAGRSAHHEVIFGASGQTLSLRHDTLGRDCYMPAVMRTIREVVNLKTLVVGLDKILGLS